METGKNQPNWFLNEQIYMQLKQMVLPWRLDIIIIHLKKMQGLIIIETIRFNYCSMYCNWKRIVKLYCVLYLIGNLY